MRRFGRLGLGRESRYSRMGTGYEPMYSLFTLPLRFFVKRAGNALCTAI